MKAERKNHLSALNQLGASLRRPLVAIVLGFLFGAIVIAVTGENVLEVYAIMLKGSFGSTYYIASTLARATPIIFCGLSVAIAWRCGFATIGAEGQMICAGLVSAIVATSFPGGAAVRIVAAFVLGAAAGCVYSLISAVLYHKFNADLIITTLMLNYIASYVAYYLVEYFFKDRNASDLSAIQTTQLDAAARLPRLVGNFSVHLGFLIALAAAVLLWFVVNRTTFGYRTRMCGLNPHFAVYGGINSTKMLYQTLAISGGIAGLAAVCEVLGTRYRYVNDMFTAPGYAWTGIMVALLAGNNPLGVVVSAIFLAAITVGSTAVERSTSIPVEVSSMIQGVITLFMSAQLILAVVKKKKAASAASGGGEGTPGADGEEAQA